MNIRMTNGRIKSKMALYDCSNTIRVMNTVKIPAKLTSRKLFRIRWLCNSRKIHLTR